MKPGAILALLFLALALLSFGGYILFPVSIMSFSDPQHDEDFCPDAHPPECVASPEACRHRLDSYACTVAKQLFSGFTTLCLFLAALLAAFHFVFKEKVKSGSARP